MNRIALLAALLALSAQAGEGVVTETAPRAGAVEVGKPMPSFAGVDLDDGVVSLKRMLAAPAPKAVLVSFFATWCIPCRESLPVLKRAAERDGIRLLLVDVAEEADLVRSFLSERGLQDQRVLVDRFGEVTERIFSGETKLPRTFLVDSKGTTRAIFIREGADLESVLSRELAKVVQQ
jgi:thiol-disulfide isomerase/thioredoxin